MPNRCKPSTSSACPPDNSFDSEDGMPLLDVSLAESEGSREIPVVMPALVLKLTRDDSDGKPASLDERSSPGVGPSGDLNLDDAMETDDGPYRDRDFYMALETVDGIEETQLMSQGSVRKRDKKKMKSAANAARQAAKRQAESQEEQAKRLKARNDYVALRRSEMTDHEKATINRRQKEKAAIDRMEESDDSRDVRREAVAARASLRREAEDPEDRAARNLENAERVAAARANESPDETAARRLADRQRRSNDPKDFVPLAGTDDHPGAHYIGRMDNPCRHCGALYFRAETTTKGQYTMCCANGSIDIPMPPPLPTALQDLYLLDDDEGERKDFIDNIRQYNNSMAMACMKAEVKLPSGGWYTYRIHKQVYHLLGDLHPAAGQPRNFAQIFILDTAQAAAELAGRDMNSSCSEALFAKLIDIIKEHHPHAKTFKMMFEKEQEEKEQAILEGRPERRVTMTFRIRSQDDQNRYQNPTADEVAAVYVGDEEEIPGERGFTIHQRGSPTPRAMNIIDRNVDPLTYPLLFPRGQFGWTINMPYRIPRGNRENITMVEFYAHRLHVRKEFSPLFHAGKLFQQFVVDVWTRVEQNRLNFIKSNQALLRSEHLRGLQDYVAGEENGPIGRIILPASHSGSPRDMVQQYQDAMTVVSRYGKPDFFLTMTCNPKWREIQECLAPGQVAVDRPDVVARVFKLKVDELRNDLFKRNVLGRVLAYIFVVEFQKRGLPHIHMLLIMETGSKLRFSKHLSDDFVNKGYTHYEAESLAYYEMMDRMEAASEDLRKWINRSYPRIFRRGDDVDIEKCKKEGEDALIKLNKEQREAVDAILEAKNSLRGGLFFIDGPGGTGKTFVYNCLANLVLGSGEKILPMSWVGIAAALLPGGRTVASTIKLDINNGCRSSGVNLKSPLADVLRQVSLILWDEAPMSPKASLETVDTLFRKLMDVDTPFGGKTVVLGGDFRQVLPVMDKGGAAEQIANSIKKSGLWPLFQVFHLKTNVRVTADALEWSKELLRIGDGKVGAKVTGEMPIPDGLESGGDLITEIFGDLLEKGEVEKLAKVAILTPRNKEALETNNKVLDKMGGAPRIYRSLDTISPKDGQLQVGDFNHFTTEFLNTMTPSGMPPHELRVKNGAIVMLLRNLDVKNGLCNGTRMVVEEMGERILQCKFINGPRKDESVLIPRIKLNYEKNLPFIMGRLQFPIRLAFAMTVNKSQGQTFERIGLLLDEPIFSHGQFYVALSRTTTREGVKINSKSKKVNNVVYPEVLLD
ncbi:hypothetical protein CAEBREN_00452 [Caenorhabditis brenneri]|uniref:ATP-dependent DNA helicase n=1 Tax=Caenorhabditis brenneri TaxID=135651 RepID=G0NQA7_CAEBE|nr:hypothetical protein CAEBREN_00452 [Caenorhabditis brenneri]